MFLKKKDFSSSFSVNDHTLIKNSIFLMDLDFKEFKAISVIKLLKNYNTNVCREKRSTIAKVIGCTPLKYTLLRKALEEKGLIKVVETFKNSQKEVCDEIHILV